MARATRSSASHTDKTVNENDNPSNLSPPPTVKVGKAANKKRKRTAGADSDDLPTAKQPKNDEELFHDKPEDPDVEESAYPPLAGDLPMADGDAQKILEILEMADTQGLLDRVFPLDDVVPLKLSSSPSTSKSPSDSYSLRTLLKESKDHPLKVFRSAIKQLYPISSQPRARISPPAAQQLRFCQLALSLIEQASRHNIDALSLKPENIFPRVSAEDSEETDAASARRKYALVQRLPTGDLWTSLNSDLVGSDSKPLPELGTGHAELVAVLPSSSSTKPIPTLGDLHAEKKIQTKYKPPTTRHVSCGSFLDYGPYASFAPAFDNDGGDIGRMGVSSVLWRRLEKGKAREKARILGDRMRSKLAARAADDMQVDEVEEVDPADMKEAAHGKEAEKRKELLEKLFAPEESEAMQKVLDALEREENISELLLHNARALLRLQALQSERLLSSSNEIQIDSEEWKLAQMIMDTLTLLVSLRPRKPDGSTPVVVPPVSVLRVFQQTLPAEPSQGWDGTLSESRGFAVRDDATIRMKGPLELHPAAPTTSIAATAAAQTPSVAQTPAPSYSANYSYAGYSQHYRTPYSTQTQGNYFVPTPTQNVGAPQTPKVQTQTPYQSHFGSSSQYTYGSWFPGGQAAGTIGTSTPSSRKGTPQPTTAAVASTPGLGTFTNSPYLPYSAALAATTATPTRAVANTIAGKPQVNGWSTPVAAAPGTPSPVGSVLGLPSHLRPAGGMTPMMSNPSFGVATPNHDYQAAGQTNT